MGLQDHHPGLKGFKQRVLEYMHTSVRAPRIGAASSSAWSVGDANTAMGGFTSAKDWNPVLHKWDIHGCKKLMYYKSENAYTDLQ